MVIALTYSADHFTHSRHITTDAEGTQVNGVAGETLVPWKLDSLALLGTLYFSVAETVS